MPDARLVVFDGVGHCPMFEAPHTFSAAVAKFADSAAVAAAAATGPPGATSVRPGTLRRAMS
jgi:hypothetical protein